MIYKVLQGSVTKRKRAQPSLERIDVVFEAEEARLTEPKPQQHARKKEKGGRRCKNGEKGKEDLSLSSIRVQTHRRRLPCHRQRSYIQKAKYIYMCNVIIIHVISVIDHDMITLSSGWGIILNNTSLKYCSKYPRTLYDSPPAFEDIRRVEVHFI